MTQPDEKGSAERVAKEIRQLHKGRGLQAGDLDSRLGPLLGELARHRGRGGSPPGSDNRDKPVCRAGFWKDYRLAVGVSLLALSAKTAGRTALYPAGDLASGANRP